MIVKKINGMKIIEVYVGEQNFAQMSHYSKAILEDLMIY